jgi:tetraacyldisaccharide 4'-kinase
VPSYLWQREESLLRRVLLSPLLLAEGGYRAATFLHRLAYVRGVRRRIRLPLRVVSVGNLTVGGSGKTPFVAWLAREIRARGRKVAVLSRGVGGSRLRSVNVVSDGTHILLGPAEVGDEPVWVAGAARGIPVLAGQNRAALALRARALFGAEVVLLDDGFQHHRLERDLDLVCLDPDLELGNGHVLPRGPLREPPRALRRADIVLWTRARQDWKPPAAVRGLPPLCPQYTVPIEPASLCELATGRTEALAKLRGARVGLVAAVARPERLERALQHLGATVSERRIFPDHHLYRERDLHSLSSTLEWITTSKDAVKIPARWVSRRTLWILEEEVLPVDGSRLVESILLRIDRGRRA